MDYKLFCKYFVFKNVLQKFQMESVTDWNIM